MDNLIRINSEVDLNAISFCGGTHGLAVEDPTIAASFMLYLGEAG